MIKNGPDGQYSHVECDTCGKRAPPNAEILKAHGLEHGFGWACSGGAHICSDCPHPPARQFLTPATSPTERRDTRTLP